MIRPSGRNTVFSLASPAAVVSGRMPWSLARVSPSSSIGIISRANRPAVDRRGGQPVGADRELVHLRAGRCPSARRSARRSRPAARSRSGRAARRGPRVAVELGDLHRGVHRHVAHVLDAAGDHQVVRAGRDQRRGHLDRGLGRPAAPVERRWPGPRAGSRPAARRCGRCCGTARRTARCSRRSGPRRRRARARRWPAARCRPRRASRWGGCRGTSRARGGTCPIGVRSGLDDQGPAGRGR